MQNTDLAWLAGIIDGEGCVYIRIHNVKNGRGHQYQSCTDVVNTDLRIINRIKEIGNELNLKSNIYQRLHPDWRNRFSKKVIYTIRFSRQNARQLIESLYPYLIAKKDQADIFLAYFKWRELQNPQAKRDGSLAKECAEGVRGFSQKLTDLKHSYANNMIVQ